MLNALDSRYFRGLNFDSAYLIKLILLTRSFKKKWRSDKTDLERLRDFHIEATAIISGE
ncbi:uncharacterized protein RSE6_04974 [Rhynchosporium secalis]|uniref:Uncharacterized protein n=1 Tax=Rhynchosporium secalis TaxID=38038 RepID=A0A1E1M7W2_RHYSE|nr:uncharacterized protein RSE6_04974 [Rhynchosporium secalis]